MGGVGYIVLTYKFHRLNRRWSAYCEELGTATFGRSLPEAERRLNEAVFLHLNTLEDVGERERFFQEQGIQLYPVKPSNPISVSFSLSLRPETEHVFLHPHIQQVPALSPA